MLSSVIQHSRTIIPSIVSIRSKQFKRSYRSSRMNTTHHSDCVHFLLDFNNAPLNPHQVSQKSIPPVSSLLEYITEYNVDVETEKLLLELEDRNLPVSSNQMVTLFNHAIQKKNPVEAFRLWNRFSDYAVEKSEASYRTLFEALVAGKLVKASVILLKEHISQFKSKGDALRIPVDVFEATKDTQSARYFWSLVREDEKLFDISLFNAILKLSVEYDPIEDSIDFFRSEAVENYDSETYTIALEGFGKNANEVCQFLYNEMKAAEKLVSLETINSLLVRSINCGNKSLTVEIFKDLSNSKDIQPEQLLMIANAFPSERKRLLVYVNNMVIQQYEPALFKAKFLLFVSEEESVQFFNNYIDTLKPEPSLFKNIFEFISTHNLPESTGNLWNAEMEKHGVSGDEVAQYVLVNNSKRGVFPSTVTDPNPVVKGAIQSLSSNIYYSALELCGKDSESVISLVEEELNMLTTPQLKKFTESFLKQKVMDSVMFELLVCMNILKINLSQGLDSLNTGLKNGLKITEKIGNLILTTLLESKFAAFELKDGSGNREIVQHPSYVLLKNVLELMRASELTVTTTSISCIIKGYETNLEVLENYALLLQNTKIDTTEYNSILRSLKIDMLLFSEFFDGNTHNANSESYNYALTYVSQFNDVEFIVKLLKAMEKQNYDIEYLSLINILPLTCKTDKVDALEYMKKAVALSKDNDVLVLSQIIPEVLDTLSAEKKFSQMSEIIKLVIANNIVSTDIQEYVIQAYENGYTDLYAVFQEYASAHQLDILPQNTWYLSAALNNKENIEKLYLSSDSQSKRYLDLFNLTNNLRKNPQQTIEDLWSSDSIKVDLEVCNLVVETLLKYKHFDMASDFIVHMEDESGITPSYETFNLILDAISGENNFTLMIEIIDLMMEYSYQPTVDHFKLIFRANYELMGDVSNALSYTIRLMRKYNVKPDTHFFNLAMLSSLKSGKVDDVLVILERMFENRVTLTKDTFEILKPLRNQMLKIYTTIAGTSGELEAKRIMSHLNFYDFPLPRTLNMNLD
eukprot:TRINITY_DN11680_c0_g1_i1.p1 TRINITY_DN11680_c0_g1~~TRINITY_DN11680_c0_g1_i1.p1  ORF type:complete len:1039 (-),score=243.17 TRINITY_DN11680_c0_g1_i1:37-3132(-)